VISQFPVLFVAWTHLGYHDSPGMENYSSTTSEDDLGRSASDSDEPIFLAEQIHSSVDSLEKPSPPTERTALLSPSFPPSYSKLAPPSSSTSLSKIEELVSPKIIYASPVQPHLPSPSTLRIPRTPPPPCAPECRLSPHELLTV
jgi:hypothetical protein